MAIDMSEMLSGVSIGDQSSETTFCNLYTSEGVSLTDQVLGGAAAEDNLLEALSRVTFDDGSSYEQVEEDFRTGNSRQVSFTYDGVQETLSYVPVKGTDWFLTYLIRERLISGQIESASRGIITRSIIQAALTIVVLLGLFLYIFLQSRKTAKLMLEKEKADAEYRIKQEEMEHRIALQNELLAEKEQKQQQDRMIRALSSDYKSVYYIEMDKNAGICYQSRTDMDGFKTDEQFPYLEAVTAYCRKYVMEPYREEFLKFICSLPPYWTSFDPRC